MYLKIRIPVKATVFAMRGVRHLGADIGWQTAKYLHAKRFKINQNRLLDLHIDTKLIKKFASVVK